MSSDVRWKPPPCASGKVAYRTQGRALRALDVIRRDAAQAAAIADDPPVATYHCACGAWHLTRSTRGSVQRPDIR